MEKTNERKQINTGVLKGFYIIDTKWTKKNENHL